jgi:hypothetical protein
MALEILVINLVINELIIIILEQIGIHLKEATILFEDNNSALFMANAQQPTKWTQHMDIKTFALQDWVQLL